MTTSEAGSKVSGRTLVVAFLGIVPAAGVALVFRALLPNRPWTMPLAMIVASAAGAGIAMTLRARGPFYRFDSIPRPASTLTLAALAALAAAVGGELRLVLRAMPLPDSVLDPAFQPATTWPWCAIWALAAFPLAAWSGELDSRGIVLPFARSALGPRLGLALVIAVPALMTVALASVLEMALLASLLVLRTRSLWPAFAMSLAASETTYALQLPQIRPALVGIVALAALAMLVAGMRLGPRESAA